MKTAKIAILGSNSHIAKGLINNFLQRGKFELHLYTRALDKVHSFLATLNKSAGEDCITHEGYRDIMKYSCDVVINCVGVGTMNRLRWDYTQYFTVTEEFDNLAIMYLRNAYPEALYISLSSGAVYGREYSASAEENTINNVRVNHITGEDYYAIARLNAEAKHRAFNDLRIIDLRIFSYFSRFIDLTDGYFITEVLDCILNKKVLKTDAMNMVRDYVHPDDLFSLIRKCMDAGMINTAFDVISRKTAEKKELLDYFSAEYGLQYDISQSPCNASATGRKYIYCSRYNRALEIGFKPEFSSMDTIREESKYLLKSI